MKTKNRMELVVEPQEIKKEGTYNWPTVDTKIAGIKNNQAQDGAKKQEKIT